MTDSAEKDAWWRRVVLWWNHLGTVDLYDDDVWKQR